MTKILMKFKEKPLGLSLSLSFLFLAALSRFVLLDNKPIHFDESINMWFVERIWQEGFFRYDPTNYHGPLLFYLIQFLQLFTGFDFLSTRWVATLFSFFTLVLLWFGPERERTAFRWAAVFLLLSPAMGFYGRSGIHESAFVFFQVVGFLSFHFLVARDFKRFWWYFSAGLLGMMALKETFVILILSFLPAAALILLIERKRWTREAWIQNLVQSFKSREVYIPLLGMVLLFLGVYSGFGSNPRGIVDFFVALMPWLKTGVQGHGHEKGFLTWSEMMGKNEFAILAGAALSLPFLLKNRWILFYFTFSFLLWLIYSLIPYKTPWCLISILWPFAVLAGFGVEEFLKKFKRLRWRVPVATTLGILLVAEAWIMGRVLYRDPIDMDHAYVYVNSTYQMKEFIKKTQEVISENPLLREQTVQVGTEESWPIPIVFKTVYNLSYFRPPMKVEDGAMIYMADTQDQKLMEDTLKARQQSALYGKFTLDVRQGRSPILVYLKKDLFQGRFSWPLKNVESP